MLRATPETALSLTAVNAGGDPAGLRTALGWLAVGLPLVAAYYVFLFRFHRGRSAAAAENDGA
jgi:cytochrome bd-type quinol oxidase subunit 2